MSKTDNQSSTGEIILRVLRYLKNNLILIILIVLLSIGCGFAYSSFSKPTYTATESVSYKATVTTGSKYVNFSSVTAMEAYYQSVVEFCRTGNVLDRADFYYNRYLTTDYGFKNDLDGFIAEVNGGQHVFNYEGKEKNLVYSGGQVGVSKIDDETFVLKVTLTDSLPELAKDKLRIYILAANMEMKDAFAGVDTVLTELSEDHESIAVTTNSSRSMVIVVFGIIGVVLACAIVYLKSMLDNKIRERDELERLVGAQLFSCLDDQGVAYARRKK